MEGNKKGSTVLAVIAAVLVIGVLLFFGIKSANKQNAVTTSAPAVQNSQGAGNQNPAVNPTQAGNNQPAITSSVSVDTDLQNIDAQIGGLGVYQAGIDNAINDKQIATGL